MFVPEPKLNEALGNYNVEGQYDASAGPQPFSRGFSAKNDPPVPPFAGSTMVQFELRPYPVGMQLTEALRAAGVTFSSVGGLLGDRRGEPAESNKVICRPSANIQTVQAIARVVTEIHEAYLQALAAPQEAVPQVD